MQAQPVFQSCRSADLAGRVFPDASQLCAVALDSRRVSAQTSTSMDWNSLAAAACSIVSPSNAYCYNVPGYSYLVVGLGVVDTSYRRRRLLLVQDEEGEEDAAENDDDDDDEDEMLYAKLRHNVLSFGYWNSTLAAPCARLAHAISFEKNLSITDVHALERCVRWRRAGRTAMAELNLTSLQEMDEEIPWEAPDRLFMSLEDFAAVLSKRSFLGMTMHCLPFL